MLTRCQGTEVSELLLNRTDEELDPVRPRGTEWGSSENDVKKTELSQWSVALNLHSAPETRDEYSR